MVSSLYPIAFLDPPEILTASVTNIPAVGSSPLQVVADIGTKAAYAIDYIDTTGDFIAVYVGASGSEVMKCIIGGGQTSRAYVVIPAGSRVSFTSLTSTAITSGSICCTFMGC